MYEGTGKGGVQSVVRSQEYEGESFPLRETSRLSGSSRCPKKLLEEMEIYGSTTTEYPPTQTLAEHSKCVSPEMLVFLLEEDNDVALIQQP